MQVNLGYDNPRLSVCSCGDLARSFVACLAPNAVQKKHRKIKTDSCTQYLGRMGGLEISGIHLIKIPDAVLPYEKLSSFWVSGCSLSNAYAWIFHITQALAPYLLSLGHGHFSGDPVRWPITILEHALWILNVAARPPIARSRFDAESHPFN